MIEDYNEMSDAELAELQRKIEKELAQRKQANKPEKLLSQKPRAEKPKVKAPPLEKMWAMFCRKCGQPIWEYIVSSSGFPHGTSEAYFYVEGREGKPVEVTHCPNCKRKLSSGRLKFSDEIEEGFHAATKRSNDSPKTEGTLWHEYCVECGHLVGVIKDGDAPQFFDEGDRQKPINVCPICHTPLKEADDVDLNNEQRAMWGSLYKFIHQRAEEIRASQRELDQLLEKIRAKKPASLEGIKAIIGVYINSYGRDQTSLEEQLAKCRDYCKTNGLEITKDLNYSYQSSDKNLKLDKLLETKIGAIVASMNWLTGHSLDEAIEFVRELEQAGIHLEIIAGDNENQE